MIDPGVRIGEALAGRYRIVRELGSGATATVYLAHDDKHDRQVAIKVLRPDLTATLAGERFLREVAIAAQLQHPHILPLLDSGEAAGSVYFVMPFAEGETLRTRLARAGRLSVAETVRIMVDVADALVYAHGRGVIHRDIKPDNIMLSGRHAVVMDFGVAKALNAAGAPNAGLTVGVALGTPAYMAPEQALADPRLDHRVDLYALGVLGYELLTGHPPFRGGAQDVLTAHVVMTPEPVTGERPDLPAPLAELIMRCLAKEPDQRPDSAAAMVERLDPLATPSGGMTPATVLPARRWRRWYPGSVAGVIGLAMVIWAAASRRGPAPNPPIRPEQLTFLGTPIEAAISPDGQFLAYVVRGSRQRLFVRDLTGSAALPLAEAEQIVDVGWLATGAGVTYRQFDSAGWSSRSAGRFGGAPRVLFQGTGLVSPDGQRVLLLQPSRPAMPIVALGTGDTAARVRTDGFRWLAGVAWRPGSDQLALALSSPEIGRTALAVFGVDGTERIVVRDSIGIVAPAWDPRGSAIYYVRSRSGFEGDVMRIGVDDTGRPTSTPELVLAGLAIVSDSRRSPTLSTLSIARTGALVYVRTQVSSNLARASAEAVSGPPRLEPLTIGTAHYLRPVLSPDGRRLAVYKVTSQGAVLGIAGVQGGAFEEVTAVAEPGAVAWAPDGKSLGFTAGWAEGGFMVGTYDIPSSRLRRAGAGRVGADLDWVGPKLVVQGPGSRDLVLVDPVADRVVPLSFGDSVTMFFQPRVSAAANRVAFLGSRQGGQVGIWTRSLASFDQAWSPLREGLSKPLRWNREGTVLYAVDIGLGEFNRLVAIPVRQGSARVGAVFGADVTVEDVSADGRTVIVNQLVKQSDVWMAVVPLRSSP